MAGRGGKDLLGKQGSGFSELSPSLPGFSFKKKKQSTSHLESEDLAECQNEAGLERPANPPLELSPEEETLVPKTPQVPKATS